MLQYMNSVQFTIPINYDNGLQLINDGFNSWTVLYTLE